MGCAGNYDMSDRNDTTCSKCPENLVKTMNASVNIDRVDTDILMFKYRLCNPTQCRDPVQVAGAKLIAATICIELQLLKGGTEIAALE
ncbi:hypothetical protein V500_00964 [Pseudogymnoascus sp. VKM F-4518 (FW-2643)]|nr:hypothetical protein V500_00964 [Pseudogymnoascus sp. VKM F-4518 (FW-2643)]